MTDNPDHQKVESGGGSQNMAEQASRRTGLADDRTAFAEDRTLMANERTFAGWMRTGLTAVGIGLGFHALFGKMDPSWLPKAIATVFIAIGIFIFYVAQRNGCAVFKKLHAHNAQPLQGVNLRLVASTMSTASFALIVGIWFMTITP